MSAHFGKLFIYVSILKERGKMHLTGMSKVCFSWLLLYTLILKLVFDPGLLKAALGIYSFFFSFLFFSIFFLSFSLSFF